MARLPNSGHAILDLRKIEDYCLNPAHPRGRHKARVLRNALGLERSDALWLRDALLEGVQAAEVFELRSDLMGSQWRVDIPVARHARLVVIRTL